MIHLAWHNRTRFHFLETRNDIDYLPQSLSRQKLSYRLHRLIGITLLHTVKTWDVKGYLKYIDIVIKPTIETPIIVVQERSEAKTKLRYYRSPTSSSSSSSSLSLKSVNSDMTD
jgi:hypothetical protein